MPDACSDTRVCDHCGEAKPLAEFRRRARGGAAWLHQCNACHNSAERRRRARQRARADRRQTGLFLAEFKNERDDARLAAIGREMAARFGGVQGVVEAWAEYHKRAIERGGLDAVRSFETLFRLMRYREANSPDPGDTG